MKHRSYLNRALRSSDRRYARVFAKLGYDVAALSTEAGVVLPAIPDEWRELSWAALKSLSASVSDDKIKSKEDAIAAIEVEIERRAKAAS